MDNKAFIIYGILLLVLIFSDIWMIVSLLKNGDERRQLIVWKASTSTLLIVVAVFVIDIFESLLKNKPALINPFIRLSVTAVVYLLTLLYYRKKHGD